MAKGNRKGGKSSGLNFEIVEIYGYLDDAKTKIYAKVRWFDREARDEVRNVLRPKDGGDDILLGKGISLSPEEIGRLAELVKKRPKPVDFDAIFASSVGIAERRAANIHTVDGFMVLRARPGFDIKKRSR